MFRYIEAECQKTFWSQGSGDSCDFLIIDPHYERGQHKKFSDRKKEYRYTKVYDYYASQP